MSELIERLKQIEDKYGHNLIQEVADALDDARTQLHKVEEERDRMLKVMTSLKENAFRETGFLTGALMNVPIEDYETLCELLEQGHE